MITIPSRLLRRGFAGAAFFSTAALLFTQSVHAQPRYQPIEFHGGGYIADFRNCEAASVGTGVMPVTARYEPGELDGNHESSLTVNSGFSAYSFNLRRVNNAFEEEWARVRGTHLSASPLDWSERPRLRVTRLRPPEIDLETPRIRLVIQIRHMFNIRGCRAEIHLDMLRQ